jgi:death-on-curing protein
VERIELGDFLLIAEIHTGIRAERLARMDRVIQLGQAALAAPFAGFGDFEAHPGSAQKAAVYCSRIVSYHPLPDGNKRTGYDVMREFLDRNGLPWEHPAGGLQSTAGTIEDLAAALISEQEFCAWVADRLR